jgi:hypothetical protein
LCFEVLELFELSPNKISFLDTLSKSKPVSSVDKTSHHAGVVAFANKYFQSMLILKRRFNKYLVCPVDFP